MIHPYTALVCFGLGAVALIAALTLAVTVLALRLGKVSRERDAERAAREHMARRAQATYQRIADWLAPHDGPAPITRISMRTLHNRPTLHFGDRALGEMARGVPTIRIDRTPAREGS